LDCIHNESVEIGIKTLSDYRKQGYASLAVNSLITKLNEAGIKNIGWHCMATNTGSIKTALKCGFREVTNYEGYYPFPPIENVTDLSKDGWYNLGEYYKDKGKISPDQYWQAAKCYANSFDVKNTLTCISELIDKDQLWFLDYIDECPEFSLLINNKDWKEILYKAGKKASKLN
jgi:hypothetical protein